MAVEFGRFPLLILSSRSLNLFFLCCKIFPNYKSFPSLASVAFTAEEIEGTALSGIEQDFTDESFTDTKTVQPFVIGPPF